MAAEKAYLTRADSERWERVNPFSSPGHDDRDRSLSLLSPPAECDTLPGRVEADGTRSARSGNREAGSHFACASLSKRSA
jgi:hypothetical protein